MPEHYDHPYSKACREAAEQERKQRHNLIRCVLLCAAFAAVWVVVAFSYPLTAIVGSFLTTLVVAGLVIVTLSR